ncbi:MAG: glycosyltransferase [Ardenticatenales bacterium]|nr:glycosyltransferase [Ardenticatenales bacterium]
MTDLAPALAHPAMATFLTVLYTVGFGVVALFSLRAAVHVVLWFRTGGRGTREGTKGTQGTVAGAAPYVTVQLPIYNERHVAARAIDAACALRWPPERFEVQVVDDSTDDTRAVVDEAARRWRARGVDVAVVRRADRRGFKGGALGEAIAAAKGDALAVFDADFRPPADWLLHVMPHLTDGVAAVQTRWGHLNREQNVLTRVQALSLDGYFGVEQTARSRAGLALHFNGSAGVWRRAAIDAAGGWSGDTLCEDVDLSYRAQLAGLRIVMLPEHEAPAELPATVLAFKRQQHRWAKGTVQCWRRLVRRIARSDWPLPKRLHAVASLSTYFVQPMLVLLFLGAPLLAVWRPRFHPLLFAFSLLALTMPVLVGLGQYSLSGNRVPGDSVSGPEDGWWRRLLWYPCLSIVAAGMSLNGALAVVEALTCAAGEFERTPKAGEDGDGDGDAASTGAYRLPLNAQSVCEAGLAAYAWFGIALAVDRHAWGVVAFVLPFALGFSYIAWWSLVEGFPIVRRQRRRRFGRALS